MHPTFRRFSIIFRQTGIAFIFASLFPLFGGNSMSYADDTLSKKHLVFLGDSITAGFGVDPEQAYPSLIEGKIAAKKLPVEVVNAGISGDTSASGLSRVDWVLRSGVDYLFIALGSNDGLRGISPQITKKNLLEIIRRARAKNSAIKIILAGNLIPPSMGREYYEEFRKIYPEIAEETKVTLLPFLLEGVAGDPKLNIEDGIHPTAEGQRIIAQNVWLILQPLLEEK